MARDVSVEAVAAQGLALAGGYAANRAADRTADFHRW